MMIGLSDERMKGVGLRSECQDKELTCMVTP
jgi:hypothetical protein